MVRCLLLSGLVTSAHLEGPTAKIPVRREAGAVLDQIESGMNQVVSYARQLSSEYHRLTQLSREARLRPTPALQLEIAEALVWIEQLVVDALQQSSDLTGWRTAYARLIAAGAVSQSQREPRIRYSSGCETSPRWSGELDADVALAQASLHQNITLARAAVAAAKRIKLGADA